MRSRHNQNSLPCCLSMNPILFYLSMFFMDSHSEMPITWCFALLWPFDLARWSDGDLRRPPRRKTSGIRWRRQASKFRWTLFCCSKLFLSCSGQYRYCTTSIMVLYRYKYTTFDHSCVMWLAEGCLRDGGRGAWHTDGRGGLIKKASTYLKLLGECSIRSVQTTGNL